MKNALPVSLIRLYQRHLSPRKGFRCAHDVWYGAGGCSGCAIGALQRHGALAGSYLTLRRLLRCHPGCDGGCDPVPPQPPRFFTRLIDRERSDPSTPRQPS